MFEPHINNDFLFGRVRLEGSDLALFLLIAAQSQKSAPVTPLHRHLYSYPVVILYKLLTLIDKHSEDS